MNASINITVMSLPEAWVTLHRNKSKEFDKIISLLDVNMINSHYYEFAKTNPDHTCLFFEDCEVFGWNNAPNIYHVQNIVQACKNKSNILVHCHAGISRSTAAAIGLLVNNGVSVEDAFTTISKQREKMWPNSLIMRHFDNILGNNGELEQATKIWKNNQRNIILENRDRI